MLVILGSNGLVCNCVEICMIIARAEITLVVAVWWCGLCREACLMTVLASI